MTATSSSWLDRLVSLRQRPWVMVGAGVALALAAFGTAFLDGALGDFVGRGYWRLLMQPIIVTYILLVHHLLERTEEPVRKALRPLIPLDDDRFARLVAEASRIDPRKELIAFALGALFGVVASGGSLLRGDFLVLTDSVV